jgi:hypothetical protein
LATAAFQALALGRVLARIEVSVGFAVFADGWKAVGFGEGRVRDYDKILAVSTGHDAVGVILWWLEPEDLQQRVERKPPVVGHGLLKKACVK